MYSRYDIAKDEFEIEDDDGKHRLVYAYFGLAIFFGQFFLHMTQKIFVKIDINNKQNNKYYCV
ncbi:hypothetical protein SPPR111872_00450 [Sphingobacterium prati]